MATQIITCTCEHEFQDKEYGKGMRVHNSMSSDKGDWRCTVCGKVKGGRNGQGARSM